MGPALQVLFNINRLLSTTNQQNSLNGSIILFKQGLTGLVRMPTGCGEQNMVLFTPIIYVVRYLSATNQLDDAIKKKSFDFMKTGK